MCHKFMEENIGFSQECYQILQENVQQVITVRYGWITVRNWFY